MTTRSSGACDAVPESLLFPVEGTGQVMMGVGLIMRGAPLCRWDEGWLLSSASYCHMSRIGRSVEVQWDFFFACSQTYANGCTVPESKKQCLRIAFHKLFGTSANIFRQESVHFQPDSKPDANRK
jgi:hypothetical protein